MNFLPLELLHFLYITTLSFLTGLELKAYRLENNQNFHIGSTRTFTFIGILGFVFYKINIYLYICGYLSLSAIYLGYYFYKIRFERSSIISFMLISLVYSFGGLIENFNIWMPTLVFVLIIFTLNANKNLKYLFEQINIKEFETLGKFLLLSAVILPILPDKKIEFINISPFRIWFVVVIISTISYGSYIAQKYIFKNRGYLLTGILGGLYSSTATTVVLSKKSKNTNNINLIDSAIIIATAMMYIRIFIIALIFNKEVAYNLLIPIMTLTLFGVLIAFIIYKKDYKKENAPIDDRNPLELQTAFLFAILFIIMIIITNFVIKNYGEIGLKILSFIIGFTDIDPFVLSLLTGKYEVKTFQIASSILIASGSNNILKSTYTLIFGKNKPKLAAFWLLILGVLTISFPFILKII